MKIKIALNERAFRHLQKGEIDSHDELVHEEMDRLAHSVDVLALGQVSLAQIRHKTRVPVLQVGHSGLAEARRLLNLAPGNGNGKERKRAEPRMAAARN